MSSSIWFPTKIILRFFRFKADYLDFNLHNMQRLSIIYYKSIRIRHFFEGNLLYKLV